MRNTLRFLWRTLLAGVLFLVPILIVLVVVHHAVMFLAKVVHPIAVHLPFPSMLGLQSPEIVAFLLLVLIGAVAGLVAQTAWAAALTHKLEQIILSKMPGYNVFKNVTESAAGVSKSEIKVAFARIDDALLLSFIIETHDNGMLTVFVPSAPTPAAGSLYFLTESQVHRLDIPVHEAVKIIKRLGLGSREILKGKFPPQAAAPQEAA